VDKTPEKTEIIKKLAPHAYLGYDKQGRPIYYEKTGKLLCEALSQLITIEEFVNSHVVGFEHMFNLCFESSQKHGRVIDCVTAVLDLEGLGIGHRIAIPFLSACSAHDAKYYPHKVAKVLVLNAPWAAHMLWPAVSVFVDAHTRSQVEVCPSLDTLQEFIDIDQLPQEYGGRSEASVVVQDASELLASLAGGVNDGYDRLNIGAGASESRSIASDLKDVSLGGSGVIFSWFFESEGEYDVDFSVTLKLVDGKQKIIEPVTRCVKSKGEFKVDASPENGEIKLEMTWDNTFSWMTSKDVKYLLSVTTIVQGVKGANM